MRRKAEDRVVVEFVYVRVFKGEQHNPFRRSVPQITWVLISVFLLHHIRYFGQHLAAKPLPMTNRPPHQIRSPNLVPRTETHISPSPDWLPKVSRMVVPFRYVRYTTLAFVPIRCGVNCSWTNETAELAAIVIWSSAARTWNIQISKCIMIKSTNVWEPSISPGVIVKETCRRPISQAQHACHVCPSLYTTATSKAHCRW